MKPLVMLAIFIAGGIAPDPRITTLAGIILIAMGIDCLREG